MTDRPRARPAEFGSVQRLPSGRFRARYTVPGGGRHHVPGTFATRKDARDALARLRAEVLNGNPAVTAPTRTTVGEYVRAYLDHAAGTLRPRTLDLYQRTAASWLLAPVGRTRSVDLSGTTVQALTPALVRSWHTALLESTHAAALHRRPRSRPDEHAGRTAAAGAYRLLRTIMGQAVSDGLIPTNPVNIKGAATAPHPERRPLTPQEVERLAAAMPARYRAAVLVGAYSGLRPGELFALRRSDVDTTAGTVRVERTQVEVSGKPMRYGPPKTDAGARTVNLPAFATAALSAHLGEFTGAEDAALVFTTAHGNPVRSSARSGVLSTARARIARPDATWHHLRHTGATLAAQAGATQAELKARIGHSSNRAAALYQHAAGERDRDLAARLDALARPHEPTPPAPPEPPQPEPTPPALALVAPPADVAPEPPQAPEAPEAVPPTGGTRALRRGHLAVIV